MVPTFPSVCARAQTTVDQARLRFRASTPQERRRWVLALCNISYRRQKAAEGCTERGAELLRSLVDQGAVARDLDQ